MDIESLQRKKFKLDELPLTPAQHTSIQSLLHSFKKKGGFDSVRSGIWKEFDNGVLWLASYVLIFLTQLIGFSTGAQDRLSQVAY